MKKNLLKFLSHNYSKNTEDVNRLLVSAFIINNKIVVEHNQYIKSFLITKKNQLEHTALQEFLSFFDESSSQFTADLLIELFEFVISPEDKIITGAVYTPPLIIEYIVDNTLSSPKNLNETKVADISCGCGGFLYYVAKILKKRTNRSYFDIFSTQIFGLDIQEYSSTRTKILLALLSITGGEDIYAFKFNIHTGNALDFNWEQTIKGFKGFDVIVGNPPYVCSRNISEESKLLLENWEVCKTGHPDLYIPFFQIAIENLREGGILGYITMNSFFKSLNARALRRYFQSKSFAFRIIDFGSFQVFKSKSTYTCICIIEKQTSTEIRYYKAPDLDSINNANHNFYSIDYGELNAENGWNLTLNSNIISKIERTGSPFSTLFKTRNGIATLKNNVYIFTPQREDKIYYYLESNGFVYPIEKEICKEIVNPNTLASIENKALIREKIIFPYEYIDNSLSIIKENFLKKSFPCAFQYLTDNKKLLETRDKGKGKSYNPWYIYGRNQSLEKLKYKLFLPHISASIPNYTIDTNDNLLFYNGLAVVGKSRRELLILKKLLSSRLFWFYITNTSKPYGSEYFSLSKNYIKNFGIFNFSKEDEEYILQQEDKSALNSFFEEKYNIRVPKGKLLP